MKTILPTILFLLWTPLASAETIHLMNDTHDLAPPYSQDWYATIGDSFIGPPSESHEVYIRGVGKKGDFYGVLYLNCKDAEYSEWIMTGGFNKDPGIVPSAAIAELRRKAC